MGQFIHILSPAAAGHIIAAPAFGNEQHFLFSPLGVPVCTPYVDDFLKAQHLIVRTQLLPLPPVPDVRPPRGLTASRRQAFRRYLAQAPEKAFAVDSGGIWGYEYERRTATEAKEAALMRCHHDGGQNCRVVMLNDTPVSSEHADGDKSFRPIGSSLPKPSH